MSDIDREGTLIKILGTTNRLKIILGRDDLGICESIDALMNEVESLRAQLSQSIPDGYVLAPIEPTWQMIDAANKAYDEGEISGARGYYKAMLSAITKD